MHLIAKYIRKFNVVTILISIHCRLHIKQYNFSVTILYQNEFRKTSPFIGLLDAESVDIEQFAFS